MTNHICGGLDYLSQFPVTVLAYSLVSILSTSGIVTKLPKYKFWFEGNSSCSEFLLHFSNIGIVTYAVRNGNINIPILVLVILIAEANMKHFWIPAKYVS